MGSVNYCLCLIADPTLCLSESDFVDRIRDAIDGGVTLVQLRDKRADLALARTIREVTREMGIPLIINDFPEVALEVEAEGVHVGQQDPPVDRARELLGPDAVVGLSVENQQQLEVASRLPIDYVGISGIFPSSTKRIEAPPWGIEGLRTARRSSSIKMIAYGGIHVGNCASVLQAGPDGIALSSAIFYHSSPKEAARNLREIIDRG